MAEIDDLRRAADGNLMRAIFDGALDAMLLTDDSGTIVDANSAANTLFDVPPGELRGKSYAQLSARPLESAGWARFLAEGRARGQFSVLRPSGTTRQTEYTAVARVAPGVHLAVLRDVTDLESTRDAQRASEARFRAMVEKSQDGIALLSADVRPMYRSPAAVRLFGYSPEQREATPWGDFLLDHEKPRLQRALEQLLARHGESIAVDFEMRHSDGRPRWVELTATNLLHDPDIGALVANFRDITERKTMLQEQEHIQARLVETQKLDAVGRLAGGIAHDFNNLLSVILSCATMALEELEPGRPLRIDLEQIEAAARRASELTRQLLAFSRQQVVRPTVLDLGECVRGLQKMLSRLLGESIRLTFTTGQNMGRVHVDPGQLEQVVLNLALNARDAMPEGGELALDVTEVALDADHAAMHEGLIPGPYVKLAITDSGAGMDAATLSRIFEPFFTTKPRDRGTGLGLATAYGIIKQSGGHISARSALGVGTTFEIYLPVTQRVAGPAAEAPPSPAELRGDETILLVEDENSVRAIMRAGLRKQGYRVLEAANGGEALLVCEQHAARIDLLVTDVVMPRMNGRQLAERLVRVRPDMRVLYISGYADDVIGDHGVLQAGIAYLQKPFTPDALAAQVRRVLDAAGAPEQAC